MLYEVITYAFPIETVLEVLRVEAADIASIEGSTTADLRGQPLSLLNVRDLLHVPGNHDNGSRRVVVIQHRQLPGDAYPVV